MNSSHSTLCDNVILAARAFAKLGYLHAFGHISARAEAGFVITPTAPAFLAQKPSDLLWVNEDAEVLEGAAGVRPIEAFLHAAIYRLRPEVHAICRSHAPHASAILTQDGVPPIRHGFGGIAETIAVLDDCDLIHNPSTGARAAQCLGSADALVLRGNGVLTVGSTLGEAAARMWSLEERCTFERLCAGGARAFSAQDLSARRRWYPAEAGRIWMWLQHVASS